MLEEETLALAECKSFTVRAGIMIRSLSRMQIFNLPLCTNSSNTSISSEIMRPIRYFLEIFCENICSANKDGVLKFKTVISTPVMFKQ